jgi:formylglycine-generating enzyme required for sulfatase activity
VTWVSCEDAEAYATWADCRLPTFEEWQRAVRADDERPFPWGNEIDKPRCNTAELGVGGDAEAYATWADCRLPTFEEWQRAVRADDERPFPWGNEIDKPRCNTAELGVGGTTPIGTFPEGVSLFGCYTTPVGTFPEGVSPFGCYDMLGNVWEWTSTWYDDDDDMLGNVWEWTSTWYDDDDPQFRVVRGGAWYYNHEHSTSTSYDFFSKEYTEFVIGFRVAR